MTATSSAADQTFTVVVDDDEALMAEGRIRRIDAGPTWAKHSVRIVLDEDQDTSGHASASDLAVSLRFEDDVEGHALSLHFPNAQKADEFRKRLLAGGVVAGALIVGVTAAQLSAGAPTTSVAAPAPIVAPAPGPIAQPLTNPRIPAVDLAPIVAPVAAPIAQPATNPRIPAVDLAPIVAPAAAPIAQPATNPRIPAEDLAPSSSKVAPVAPVTDPAQFRRGK